MNGYGLYWGDYLAVGILLGILGVLMVALIWDVVAIKIADYKSALDEEHWATIIREEQR
jgi:hypothetical protein